MDKAEIAYYYAKASLDNEFKSFDSLDNKANKFLSLVTLGIGLVVSLVGWGFDKFIPLKTASSCITVFLIFVIIFFLSNAWFKLFKSIKVSDVPTIKLNDEVCKILVSPETDVLSEVIGTYSNLVKAHRETMSKKVELLESGYRYIALTAVAILILLFSIVVSQSIGVN
ncbi:hypothetical protein GCM10027342_54300 [Photobacterium alginatilyticum]|uniref:SMODS and SLOG-associating 2TM effector domain-containing protein n=1 Tax=Photobacterium alginatilyticum TaxID=1775171 RepID=A0ABW9YRI1_9GAMM|nr:hypothetical protein [Photobacterium alginatilyticum]NBI56354.1 hypothetical protein [Photobacterium alginatilyticum]